MNMKKHGKTVRISALLLVLSGFLFSMNIAYAEEKVAEAEQKAVVADSDKKAEDKVEGKTEEKAKDKDKAEKKSGDKKGDKKKNKDDDAECE
jgi:hypothetical protein